MVFSGLILASAFHSFPDLKRDESNRVFGSTIAFAPARPSLRGRVRLSIGFLQIHCPEQPQDAVIGDNGKQAVIR